MNNEKINKYITDSLKFLYTSSNELDKNGYLKNLVYAKKTDTSLLIVQDKNINITKYNFTICIDNNSSDLYSFFKTLKFYYRKGKTWNLFTKNNKFWSGIEVDFNNQIKEIRIETTTKIFEPIDITLEYQFADKEAYYAEIEKQKIVDKAKEDERLKKLLSPEVRDGLSLLNISWCNVDREITRTEVELYWDVSEKDSYDFKIPDPATCSYNKKFIYLRRIILNKHNADICFDIIKDLAFGYYYIKISQYKGNKLIIESDYIKYYLRSYNTNSSGKTFIPFTR